jgi:hypothetical protein
MAIELEDVAVSEKDQERASSIGSADDNLDVDTTAPDAISASTRLRVWHSPSVDNSTTHARPSSDPRFENLVDEPDQALVDLEASDCNSVVPYSTTTSERTTPPAHIIIHFHLDDHTHTRWLDYAALSRWESMEDLLEAFAHDGIVTEELWDVHQEMCIGAGDWNARMRPGVELDVICAHMGNSSDCSSEDEEDEDVWGSGACDESVGKHLSREHCWWFERWRRRVEGEVLPGGQESPRLNVVLGIVSVTMLIGLALLLCVV